MTAPAIAESLKITALACQRGEALLFEGLSFAVAPGEGLFLHGPNGSGKSSLLRMLAGLLTPPTGRIEFAGRATADDLHAYRRNLAYLGHLDGLKPGETPREALAFLAKLRNLPLPRGRGGETYGAAISRTGEGVSRTGEGVLQTPNSAIANTLTRFSKPSAKKIASPMRERGRDAITALESVAMHPHADTPIRYLSAGQKRRVALAGILSSQAKLWLLDEPTTALDAVATKSFYAHLAGHLIQGGLFVVATHDDPPAIPGVTTLQLGAA